MQIWNESLHLTKEKLLNDHYQKIVSLPVTDETEPCPGGDQSERFMPYPYAVF